MYSIQYVEDYLYWLWDVLEISSFVELFEHEFESQYNTELLKQKNKKRTKQNKTKPSKQTNKQTKTKKDVTVNET